jgi:esterase/lipase superfamily enzyme
MKCRHDIVVKIIVFLFCSIACSGCANNNTLYRRTDRDQCAYIPDICAREKCNSEMTQRLVNTIASNDSFAAIEGSVMANMFSGLLSRSLIQDEAVVPDNPKYIEVPIFYATDRNKTGRDGVNDYFGGEWGELSFGKVNVTIPPDHRVGYLETPYWWHLEFTANPDKDVTVSGVHPIDEVAFKRELREKVITSDAREALIFIHGYNTSFADAARRTGQITHDLEFKGPSILYSWPSQGTPWGYFADETNAERTIPHLEYFIGEVIKITGARKVHIIAHSMGGRILVQALNRLKINSPERKEPVINEVLLAAPDIDAEVFRGLASRVIGAARRTTLYVSKHDEALALSEAFHEYQRAGDSGEGVVVVDGADTIDVSSIDTSLIGHAYVGDNRTVLSDIYYAIRGVVAKNRHGLQEKRWKQGKYWVFRP